MSKTGKTNCSLAIANFCFLSIIVKQPLHRQLLVLSTMGGGDLGVVYWCWAMLSTSLLASCCLYIHIHDVLCHQQEYNTRCRLSTPPMLIHEHIVSCPAHVCLPARNSLGNEIEFLKNSKHEYVMRLQDCTYHTKLLF